MLLAFMLGAIFYNIFEDILNTNPIIDWLFASEFFSEDNNIFNGIFAYIFLTLILIVFVLSGLLGSCNVLKIGSPVDGSTV